eukprot:195447_1
MSTLKRNILTTIKNTNHKQRCYHEEHDNKPMKFISFVIHHLSKSQWELSVDISNQYHLNRLVHSSYRNRICQKCAFLLFIYSDKLRLFIELIDHIMQFPMYSEERIRFCTNYTQKQKIQGMLELVCTFSCFPQIRFILLRKSNKNQSIRRMLKIWRFAIEYCEILTFHSWKLDENIVENIRLEGTMILENVVLNAVNPYIVKMKPKHIYKVIKLGFFKWLMLRLTDWIPKIEAEELQKKSSHEFSKFIVFCTCTMVFNLLREKIHSPAFFYSKYFRKLNDVNKLLLIKTNKFDINDLSCVYAIKDIMREDRVSWVHCNYQKCNRKYLIQSKNKLYYMSQFTDASKFVKDPKFYRKFKLCGGCNLVYYCTRKCQKCDWKMHKQLCILFRSFVC